MAVNHKIAGLSGRKNNKNTWVTGIIIWLIISMACQIPGTIDVSINKPTETVQPVPSFAPAKTQVPIAPSLVETDPIAGSQIDSIHGISLFFDQPMDTNKVQAAFKIEPPLKGQFQWKDDNTAVRFIPGEPVVSTTQYILTLSQDARSAMGLPLPAPIEIAFSSPDPLRVVEQIPAPLANDVNPTGAVAVTFNQPVVALGENNINAPQAFTLQPDSRGRAEWINTSTYVFYPGPSLAGGTKYTLTLNPDLVSTSGMPLSLENQPVSWSFTTNVPDIVSLQPETDSLIPLDPVFTINFNQPMNPDSVQSFLSLQQPDGTNLPVQITWNEDHTQLTCQPASLLQRNTEYRLSLTSQAQAANSSTLAQTLLASFTTVSELQLLKTNPPVGQLLNIFSGYSSFIVDFNVPLARQNWQDKVFIDPPIGDMNTYASGEDNTLYLSGFFQPNTTYSLILSSEIKDQWGGTLNQPLTIQFNTAPSPPQFTVPALQLGSRIVFLPLGENQLQVNASNLNSITVASESLTLNQFVSIASFSINNNVPNIEQPDWARTQPVKTLGDQTTSVFLDLTDRDRPLNTGLYHFSLHSPEIIATEYNQPATFLAVISRVQMTVKRSQNQIFIWAVDMDQNQPVANTQITLYDTRLNAIQSTITDAAGTCQITLPENTASNHYFAIMGQPGDDQFALGMDTWSSGVDGSYFGYPTDLFPENPFAYIYTDRPIYQPGQVVNYRAIVKNRVNGRYNAINVPQITLNMYGAYSMENSDRPLITTQNLPISIYGTASGKFTLPEDALPGAYSIQLNDSNTAYANFQVAEYRKPQIEMQIGSTLLQGLITDDLQAEITAKYYFGAPAASQAVHWTVYARPERFTFSDGFSGGKLDPWWEPESMWQQGYYGNSPGMYLTEGDGTTDQNGLLKLNLKASAITATLDMEKSYRITIEATLQDQDGSSISTRASFLRYPAKYEIGIKPDTWSVAANTPLGFDIQTVDWSNNPSASQNLYAIFEKITWTQSENGSRFSLYTPEYTLVSSASLITSTSGQARLMFTPLEPGAYRLSIRGENVVSEMMIWVSGSGSAIWPDLSLQHLPIQADSKEYQPGQNARVFIPNPLEGSALALITVERGQVMRSKVVTISDPSYELSLPLIDDDAPNIYISVTLVGKDKNGLYDFRQGYLSLQVEPVRQKLSLQLTPQPQRTSPGGNVQFQILVKDFQGNPVQGEFSLALIDKAVLALADPDSPNILDAFYGQQPLGVLNSLSLAVNVHRFLPEFPGGRGGGDSQIPTVLREQFQDTAFWTGAIETDLNGQAQINVTLPDNLTTWVAVLRGLTLETQVGETSGEILASKDLLIRPVTPRFMVAGDHIRLGAVVHNNTPNPLEIDVSLQASGWQLDDPLQGIQKVNLAPSKSQLITWWGTAQTGDQAEFIFSARSSDLLDTTRPDNGTIPILKYNTPQTFSTSGMMTDGGERQETIQLPRSFTPSGGSLNLTLSPSLAAVILNGLQALDTYPSNFTEPILSRLLPNLEIYAAMQELALESPGVKSDMEKSIHDSMKQIENLQNQDGGWGWSAGQISDPFISAYALLAVSRANQTGFLTNENTLKAAQDYLANAVMANDLTGASWELDRLVLQMYALQHSGWQGLPIDPLLERHDQLNPWAKALLAIISYQKDRSDPRARNLVDSLKGSVILTATGAHWEENQPTPFNLGTSNLNTAVVILALAQIDPASDLLSNAVRYLTANRQLNSIWSSSYESAWCLMALTAVLKGTGELQADYRYTATLNETPIANGQAGGVQNLTTIQAQIPLEQLSSNQANSLVIQRDDGNGRLYYTASLKAYRPVESAPPLQRGISVTRQYYLADQDCRANLCTPVSQIQLKTPSPLLEVRLSITLAESRSYLVVEDSIPAGAEIIDFSLNTSQQITAEKPNFDFRDPYKDGWGWWLFSDPQIHNQSIQWIAKQLPAGTYQLIYYLQPRQPGEYRVIPAHAFEYYFPEVEGCSAGNIFTIQP